MKRFLHILLFSLGALLAAGAVIVWLLPSSRLPFPVENSPSAPLPGGVSLVLGPAPAGSAETDGRSRFAFGDKVYATVKLEEVGPGGHRLTYRWINPRGGVQESFQKDFISTGGSYRGWSWLELRGEEWLALPLGPLGPGRFLGNWRIQVELDGVPLAGAGFTVR